MLLSYKLYMAIGFIFIFKHLVKIRLIPNFLSAYQMNPIIFKRRLELWAQKV